MADQPESNYPPPPDGTPAFLASSHTQELQPVYANVTLAQGLSRKRRLYRSAPRVVNVLWVLDADQMQAVDTWFEEDLQAGNLEFSALIANLGPGLTWERVQWFEPYKATCLATGHWNVTGKLLLSVEPQSPIVFAGAVELEYTPDLDVTFRFPLDGSGVLDLS